MKLAIFDLDGTLLNTLEDLAEAMNVALSQYGFAPYPVEAYKTFVGNGVYVLVERALKEKAADKELVLKVKEAFDTYYNVHREDHTKPYDGILEMLQGLKDKGVKMAVVSNKPNAFTKVLVKEIFGEWIDIAIGHREGIPAKPHPQGVLEMLAHFNIKKEDTIYIGDSNVDIQTARNAGLYSVGVLWGFRTKEELQKEGADKLIATPLELLTI